MRSATWDSTATDDGEVTDASVRMIENLGRRPPAVEDVLPGRPFQSAMLSISTGGDGPHLHDLIAIHGEDHVV